MNTQNAEVGQIVEWSLADLAGMDTSDIAVVSSRLPAAGLYTVIGTEVKLGMMDKNGDKPQLAYINFGFEVLDFEPTKEMDEEAIQRIIGRKLSDRSTLWPEDMAESIGLVKGNYKRAGINIEEPKNLGGVEGQPQGWLDNMVEKIFQIRIRHGLSKGEERAFINWVGADPRGEEAAG